MDGCRGIVPLALALVLAGCGSGALSGPGDTFAETTTTTAETSQTTQETNTTTAPPKKTTTTTPKRQYGWNLPSGPRSPTTNEDVIYTRLVEKACDQAQQELDRTWSGLQTPRNAPLYQAAVDLCRGKTAAARSMFARAAKLGLAMFPVKTSSEECDCAVLKAVRSVLDQVPQDSVRCTTGTPPGWPTTDSSAKDDPRTDVVEGKTTTTTKTTTGTTTATSSS
jgi:hypothetical protein